MYCNNCGTEIPKNTTFCPNCGSKINSTNMPQNPHSSNPRTIKLRCKNCNATMEVNADTQEVTCPYCGYKEKILDSDAVAVEKIKSNTYKEMEYARLENQREQQAHNEKEQDRKTYSKSAFSKVTIAFTFICLLAVFGSFSQGRILSGIIALIQTALFAVSWLIGMQILGHKKKALYKALAILGFLLIIPFMVSCNLQMHSKLHWPKSGLSQYLPDPPSKYGEINIDDEDRFDVTFEKMSSDDYRSYVKACEEKGFTVDPDKSSSSYTAFNTDGYKLDISYMDYHNEMDVSLDVPEEMSEFTWPASELAQLIPQPDSNIGKINHDNQDSFSIRVGNTNEATYNDYIQKCMDAGFTVDYSKGDRAFSADDVNGNHLHLSYEGNNIMLISLDAADHPDASNDSEVQPSESDSASSDDVNNSSDISYNSDNDANTDTNSVTPELKEFLDSYESFIDEYIAFMQKYEDSNDSLSMLSDYSSMMSKYADFAQKVDAYNADEMSVADAAYYLEVIDRVNQKLINASL